MRIAAFVTGLLFSLIILGASIFALAGGTAIGVLGKTQEGVSLAGSGAYGFLCSILGIVGASLSLKFKWAAFVLLILAGLFTILIGVYTIHKNMIVFGALLFLPAIFAAVSKKK